MIGLPFNTCKINSNLFLLKSSVFQSDWVKKWCNGWWLSHPTNERYCRQCFPFYIRYHPHMQVLKSFKAPNFWKQLFIPLTIFVHKFYCRCGWTRLYHPLYLYFDVCTLLYSCQSDKTGLLEVFYSLDSDFAMPISFVVSQLTSNDQNWFTG